jgi:hypothetical protein
METNQMSKIKLRIGQIEVEYEGSEQFLKAELPALLKAVAALHQAAGQQPAMTNLGGSGGGPALPFLSSTSTVASKLGCRKGTDLVLAAATYLAMGANKPSFTRSEINDQIKSASTYYKSTYTDNLTSYLNTLVKDNKLLHVSGSTYSLHADVLTDMRTRLD